MKSCKKCEKLQQKIEELIKLNEEMHERENKWYSRKLSSDDEVYELQKRITGYIAEEHKFKEDAAWLRQQLQMLAAEVKFWKEHTISSGFNSHPFSITVSGFIKDRVIQCNSMDCKMIESQEELK